MAGWPGTSTKVKFVLAAGHDPPSNHRRSDNDNSSNCSSQYRLSLDTVRNSLACRVARRGGKGEGEGEGPTQPSQRFARRF